MNPALIHALKRHPRRLDSPHVFTNRWGKPYNDVRKSLMKAAKDARNEGGINLH